MLEVQDTTSPDGMEGEVEIKIGENMEQLGDGYLMMIEPTSPFVKPISDDLTKKAHDLLMITVPGTHYKGWHDCICGARSGSCDLVLPDGTITNSLLVHYVECHRAEIPRSELAKLLIAHREFCEGMKITDPMETLREVTAEVLRGRNNEKEKRNNNHTD